MKSPVGRAVVVRNKGQDALAQVCNGDPTGTCQHAAYQNAEPDLNLVEPGTVSGGIHEANAMAGIGEKGGARTHAGEVAAFAFDAQILLGATLGSHQAHQCLRLMGVELIGDKDPGCLRVGLDGLGDVRGKVGFGARGSHAGCHKLSGCDIQVSDQTQGAMPFLFEFLSLDVTRLHGQRGVEALEGLHTGHLIGTCHMRARRGERRSGLIHLTHRADLRGQFGGIVGRGSEPVPLPMRL